MADRELALANFEAATGCDDITESIEQLERHNWILVDAISAYIPKDLRAGPSADEGNGIVAAASDDDPAKNDAEANDGFSWASWQTEGISTSAMDFRVTPSTSVPFSTSRMISLNVEWRDQMIPLVVSEDVTIAQVKSLIEARTHVPVDEQTLRGWPHKDVASRDDMTRLSDLNLPKNVTLFLLSPPNVGKETLVSNKVSEASSSIAKVKLDIEYDGRKTMIPYSLTKTIGEFKQDMKNLFNVEPRHQEWHGFPKIVTDNMVLGDVGLLLPIHALRLTSVTKAQVDRPPPPPPSVEKMDGVQEEESSDDANYEDGDAMFSLGDDSLPQVKTRELLLPENSEDNADSLLQFLVQFQDRYGEIRPDFYVGAFGEAIKEAFECKAIERKPLVVYVHHDFSIQSNVFCSTVLCSAPVVQYLNDNFVTWGWDVTHKTNEKRLLEIVTKHFGSVVADTVENFKPDQLPVLLIVVKSRGGMDVFAVLQGHISGDELMANLMSACDAFQQAKEIDVKEEAERAARQEIKEQQDAAYKASLEADRQKAELQERARQEEQVQLLAKERAAQNVIQEKVKEEEKQRELRGRLPSEPPDDGSAKLAVLRFRFPDGSQVTRRFLAENRLELLFMFVASQGYPQPKFCIKANFPKKEISALADTLTFEAAGLCPRETLFVEEVAQ
ncbi:FAS-associated factor 1-like [Oscarella lobularis]|uniref:FAS-associated factor 1-like n=1 Tax=Oscarella lobularis TaxID=121494 RepID=UPI0033136B4B